MYRESVSAPRSSLQKRPSSLKGHRKRGLSVSSPHSLRDVSASDSRSAREKKHKRYRALYSFDTRSLAKSQRDKVQHPLSLSLSHSHSHSHSHSLSLSLSRRAGTRSTASTSGANSTGAAGPPSFVPRCEVPARCGLWRVPPMKHRSRGALKHRSCGPKPFLNPLSKSLPELYLNRAPKVRRGGLSAPPPRAPK